MARQQLGAAPSRAADVVTKAYALSLEGSGAASAFTTTVGDGSSTSIVVTHNLGTQGVLISVKDAITYEEVNVDKFATSINTVTLVFQTAPALNAYVVTIATGAQGLPGIQGNPGTIVAVGPTAPTSPAVGALWVDTSS